MADDELNRNIQEGYGRIRDAALAAAETRSRAIGEWHDAVVDAINTLDKLIARNYHPDATARGREAVFSLAGIWLDEEESERIYLGGREP